MGCSFDLTEWDEKACEESASGESYEPDLKLLEEVEREVEKEVERCLKENTESAKEFTNFEKLDKEVWPTEKESQLVWQVGKELRMSPVEIISTPEIVAVKGVQLTKEMVKDIMSQLQSSKLAPQYREQYTVEKIMFIPERRLTDRGTIERANVLKYEILKEKPEIPRTIHIFLNEKGEFPKGKDLKAIITHEIFHINAEKFRVIVIAHQAEWMGAYEAQKERGPVSKATRLLMDAYAEAYAKGEIRDPDKVQFDEEFRAEQLAAWNINSQDLCPEMEAFFDKYFTK